MSAPGIEQTEVERARQLADLLARRNEEVLRAWTRLQTGGDSPRGGGGDIGAVTNRSRDILSALQDGLAETGHLDLDVPAFARLRDALTERSRRGAIEGATPAETAHGVLALREALFSVIQTEHAGDSPALVAATTAAGRVVDSMALFSVETYVRGREDIITRQSNQLLELSTPVVRLWDGIVGLPLVGTLDSNRATIVMEAVLRALDEENASVAIIDITGVPAVDTLVAQHLFKTVTATRLMGADCIISGIRPQTALSIVQLGVDLADVTTRASLADALETAIQRVSHNRHAPEH